MSLTQKVQTDLKAAMLAREETARDTLRMLKADLTKAEMENGGELSDGQALQVVKRAVKTRQESIEQYEQAGRAEAAQQEREEISVLERYLPRQLDEDEIRRAAHGIVTELGLATKKDMGRLMKELKARHEGQIDGKLASRIAGELLSS